MELTLKVSDDVARKIKGLSVLTGKNASDITNDLSQYIEGHITQQLIQAVGIKPEDLNVVRSGYMQPVGFEQEVQSQMTTTHDFEEQSTNDALVFPSDEEEENPFKGEGDDGFSMAAGLGASEEEFDKYDDDLPEEMVEELVFPAENEDEEMDTMPVKDKDGNNVGYEDPIMADLQEELEDGSLDGVADDDYDYDDDEAEFDDDSGVRPRANVRPASIGDDTPTGEDGYTPDVLPMDYGIDHVNSEDGNHGGAMDFFTNAFDGIQGDKSARNNVRRKRIITDF